MLCLILCVSMNFTVSLTLNYFELNTEERLMRNIHNIVFYVYWREMYFDINMSFRYLAVTVNVVALSLIMV